MTAPAEGTPFCRRCLLAEFAEGKKLYELIRDYIAAIPEEQRAEEAVYRARLDACRRCDWLANGMCRQCGCYVEVRAAKAGQRCPDVAAKW